MTTNSDCAFMVCSTEVKTFHQRANSYSVLSMNVSTSPSGQVVTELTHTNTQWVQGALPYVQTESARVNGRTHLNTADT